MKIRLAKTNNEINEALKLRFKMQLEPYGISWKDVKREDLNDSPITLICEIDGGVMASCTAFIDSKGDGQLFYLAVANNLQGQGVGRQMVLEMEKELKRRGVKKNFILARDYLNDFYSSLGYKSFGEFEKHDGFFERGVLHRKMQKEL